jgi:dephospho-CoA kinase
MGKMFKVLLTGQIASGKTTVLNQFSALGVYTINADKVVKQLLSQPKNNALLMQKAPDCFDVNGLNREILRKKFFSDHAFARSFQDWIHPLVYSDINMQLESVRNSPYVVIEMPLVPSSEIYDRLCLVRAADDVCCARLRKRWKGDLFSEVKQLSTKWENVSYDDLITNDGSHDDLIKQVENLHNYYQYNNIG